MSRSTSLQAVWYYYWSDRLQLFPPRVVGQPRGELFHRWGEVPLLPYLVSRRPRLCPIQECLPEATRQTFPAFRIAELRPSTSAAIHGHDFKEV